MVVFSLAAGPLRKRWSFGRVALSALVASGVFMILLALISWYPAALLLWALLRVGTMFNINTGSLRQAIVPNQMLGRMISIARVLAWSANPIGAMGGGSAVERSATWSWSTGSSAA